ncbi:extracellular superoxide dismutase [Cu-Zn]-like [Leptodactylus fuscus]|uniref:extracellular superoxide dismutase [Cu-Zn]-like n=1 Tax=Leptodactylus fuscus TaxID=238119 RepID=UPI003F4F3517
MCWEFYLRVLFFISICSGIRADVGKNQTEMLAEMSKKLHDIWMTTIDGNIPDKTIYATCNLQPNPKLAADELQITGNILFKQVYPRGKLEAIFTVHGFPMDVNQTSRAIHVHSYGDLSNGCDSTGGHYNPQCENHPNHPGDLGNFLVQNGTIQKLRQNLKATLIGPESILGRAMVVHKLADDLGRGDNQASLENGNAGTRLACCVIGSTTSRSWDKYMQEKNQKRSKVSSRENTRKAKN